MKFLKSTTHTNPELLLTATIVAGGGKGGRVGHIDRALLMLTQKLRKYKLKEPNLSFP